MVEQSDAIVRMVNIKKQFGHVEALKGVDCELHRGEVLALVGDNGAGKSTFVKILAGVFSPTDGEIYYEGRQVHWANPGQSRAAGIEIVYQDLGLVSLMNIGRNFFLGKELTRGRLKLLDFKRMYTESLKGIKELGIVLDDPEEFVGNLSGGQQKALAIGRSLYFGVKVLILDEPTAALSIKETQIVLDVIKGLKERGIATVFITHNIHHAYSVADRFIVLAAGRELWDVKKEDVTPEQLSKAVIEGKISLNRF